ncbi:MAG: hypothetical protein NC311_18825 [Muribaculaceae bacterium]|nr:hypothetical protein [Muribaculaceae bacterium]
MAYYGNNRGRQQPEGVNVWKILSLVMALIIFAAAVLGVFGSMKDGKFFAEGDITKWFNNWGKGEEPGTGNTTSETTGENGMLLTTNSNDLMSVGAARIAALSEVGLDENEYEKAYTLTASVYPKMAEHTDYVWAINWVNAESEWAAEKTVTDYVELLSQSEDGKVIVGCKQPFKEQITITVTTTTSNDKELNVSCTVDYKQKFTKIQECFYYRNSTTLGFQDVDGGDEILNFNIPSASAKNLQSVAGTMSNRYFAPVKTIGTIATDVKEIKYSLRPSEAFSAKFEHYYSSYNPGNFDAFANGLTGESYTDIKKMSEAYKVERYFDVTRESARFVLNFVSDFYCDMTNPRITNCDLFCYLGTVFPSILCSQAECTDTAKCGLKSNYVLYQFAGFFADESIPTEDKYNFIRKIEVTADDGTVYTFERKLLVNYTIPANSLNLSKDSITF